MITEAKENNANIKNYKDLLSNSKERCQEQLEKCENKLISATLSKEEEKVLHNEITLLKRKVKEAESAGKAEIQLE